MKQLGHWLFVIGILFSAQADLTVELHPEASSLFVYEPFTLLLTTEQEIEMPQIPASAGFIVAGISPIPDSNNLRIEILPEQSGTLTIPPFTIHSGEETLQTQPLRLAISSPRQAEEMQLAIDFSATNLTVRQPVKMTVTWTSELPVTRYQELLVEFPILRDPNWDVYPLDPNVSEKQRIGLPVNGQRIIAEKKETPAGDQLIFSFMLSPKAAGTTRPELAHLSCALMKDKRASSQYPSYFDNHFFNSTEKNDHFERVWISAPLPRLTAQALPEAGRTVRFSGIVGSCTVESIIRPTETVVGQPMLLTVELNDLAYGGAIQELPQSILETLGSEFQLTPRPLHETASPTGRSFTYILRPLRSGITTVPALALQIFDPRQKAYRTLRTQPLTIRVDPDGKNTVYQPQLSESRKPKVPVEGIRSNWKESKLHMNTTSMLEFLAHNAWAFWLFPPLLWLGLRPWLNRRDRCRHDPAYARALYANREFNRAVRIDEESAWTHYLADRFNLHAEAVTYESVLPELQKKGISPNEIQAIRDRFARKDTTIYAPPGTPAKKAPSARELVRIIENTARTLLLLACLLPAFDSDATSPEELFGLATEIRTVKPDEATPLFIEAALGYENHDEFFNAANSWFFANENGRALANYRSAESRTPWNQKVRESIRFIRTQRNDVFQISERSNSKILIVWRQFGRWSTAIRGGLLTIIYLLGWATYLTARAVGKRVARRAWILLGILAIIPTLSLLGSLFSASEGVIIQATEARLGPSYAYEKAYDSILHEATEFRWMEQRNGWIRGRFPDKSEAWIRATVCHKIH